MFRSVVTTPRPFPFRRRTAQTRSLSPAADKINPLLFLAFAISVIVRFSIPENLLNTFEHYSSNDTFSAGGSIFEKIHPGSYGILLVAILMTPRILALWTKDRNGILTSMVAFAAAIFSVIVITIFTGQTASIGYLIDSTFVACAASATALCFSSYQRRILGTALLGIILVSSVMAIAEFFLKTHFLPRTLYTVDDLVSMRASGLFNHPLMLGLANVVAIPILFLTNWTRLTKAAALIVLIFGIFAAGARAATIVAILAICAELIFANASRSGLRNIIAERIMLIIGILVLAPIVWFIASSLGLTERLQQEGLVDDSTLTRLVIFQVFSLLNWNELIWGIGNFTLFKLSVFGLNIGSVENSLIVYIFQFGIIGASLLIGGLLYALFILGRHTPLELKIAIFAFLVVAFANNTLSSKSPALLLIFMVAIAFREPAVSTKKTSLGLRHQRDAS